MSMTPDASGELLLNPLPASGAVAESQPAIETRVLEAKMSARRVAGIAALWALVTVACVGLVLYALEPMFQQQTQKRLLSNYRTEISRSANEAGTLAGVTVQTLAPTLGSPVAVIEIGDIRMQQVAVEGVSAAQTQQGPGHVPGSAGPGQPGNSAFVGRRAMFGGPFSDVGKIAVGAPILVTTTQGQKVYRVTSHAEVSLQIDSAPSGLAEATASGGLNGAPATTPDLSLAPEDSARLDAIFGPTVEDRLTLVTSASVRPGNASKATVVLAKMEGDPFPPTPQGGRTDGQSAVSGDSGALAGLVLAIQGFLLAAVASVFLYRRFSSRSAYLMTMPVLLAFVVLSAEAAGRLLPAWT